MELLLTFLLTVLLAAPASAQEKDKRAAPITLSLPNTSWNLHVPAVGFVVQRDTSRPDGNARSILAIDQASGINLSVFLERVPAGESGKDCRAYYWERLRNSPVKMEEVRTTERREMAILEYTDKEFARRLPEEVKKMLGTVEQRHLHAYLAKHGVCIDIHLSKALKPGDEAPPFGAILDGVRLSDPAAAVPTTPAQHVLARVRASVVLVQALKTPAGTSDGTVASGSGFFVSQDGHILVAGHVVDGASSIAILLADGRRLAAHLVGRDAKTGLALLKLQSEVRARYPHLGFAAKDAQFGDRLFIVDGGGRIVDASIASRRAEFLEVRAEGAPMEGPLVNGNGEVAGIVLLHAVARKDGPGKVSFAVPGSTAAYVTGELRTKGKVERITLGLSLANFEVDMRSEFGMPPPAGPNKPAPGALIKKLDDNAPAYAAGLRAGDRILKLDDTALGTAGEFLRKLGDFSPGTTVSLTVVRDGKEQVLTVKLGELPN
jgi:S1-C subfamily serine protease